jgi:hypothetical protein
MLLFEGGRVCFRWRWVVVCLGRIVGLVVRCSWELLSFATCFQLMVIVVGVVCAWLGSLLGGQDCSRSWGCCWVFAVSSIIVVVEERKPMSQLVMLASDSNSHVRSHEVCLECCGILFGCIEKKSCRQIIIQTHPSQSINSL